MKTRRATLTPQGRAPGAPRVGNERGMLLVITMIILLVISTLAAASLINAFLERSIAKNQNYASVALNAADAGVDAGIAWLGDPDTRLLTGAAKVPTTGVAWTRAGDPMIRTLGSGGRYEVTISTKADDEDRDKDGSTTDIVLYNNVVATEVLGNAANNGKFGYLDAKETVAGKGYPVMTIKSRGSSSTAPGYREIVMDIGRVKDIPPGVKGAVSSKDGVGFLNSNAQLKDGRPHAENGKLCDGSEGAPVPACECDDQTDGIAAEAGPAAVECTNPPQNDLPAGCSILGKTGTTLPAAEITGKVGLCATAECVLGYTTRADLEADPNAVIYTTPLVPPASNADRNAFYATVSSALETGAQGKIFIVKGDFVLASNTHVTTAKRLVVDGTFDVGGATDFKGLIVAKNFGGCGNFSVVGALVCTGDGSGVKPFANGGVAIRFSCDALAAATGQVGYTIRLGWKREY